MGILPCVYPRFDTEFFDSTSGCLEKQVPDLNTANREDRIATRKGTLNQSTRKCVISQVGTLP